MAKPALTTLKMPGETEQQYTAWLLYCEAGSLRRTLEAWNRLGQNLGESWADFADRLGKKPSDTTLETWSKKFRWVERKDLKLQEEIEQLHKRARKVAVEKKEKIVIAFGRIVDDFFRKAESKKITYDNYTPSDFKKLWEMARTELGETLGKHDVSINENEQKPPTPEEDELGRAIDETIKAFYGRKGKAKK